MLVFGTTIISTPLSRSNWSEWQYYDPCVIPVDDVWRLNCSCGYYGENIDYGIYIESSGVLSVRDYDISSNVIIDGKLILTNASVDDYSIVNDGILEKKWYLNLLVNDYNSNEIFGYDVDIYDRFSNRYDELLEFMEYRETNNSKTYYSNYSIYAYKSLYEDNYTSINLNENKNIVLTLADFIVPIYSEFNNSLSTNFSNFTIDELISLPNVTLANDFGEISFYDDVDVYNLNLDNIVNIDNDKISIWDSKISNKSAKIVFKNLTYDSTPVILRNGVIYDVDDYDINYIKGDCTSCGVLSLNVSSFSEYSHYGNSNINVSFISEFFNKSIATIPIGFRIEYFRTNDSVIIGSNNCNISFSNGSIIKSNVDLITNFTFDGVSKHNYTISCSESNYDTIVKQIYLSIVPNETYFSEAWSVNEGGRDGANLIVSDDLLFIYSNKNGNDMLKIYNDSTLIYNNNTGLFHGTMIVLDINNSNRNDIMFSGNSGTNATFKIINDKIN